MNKATSNRIKAIAIILMVVTHVFALFSYGSSLYVVRLPIGDGVSVETIFGRAADICVYLFAFISGYGLCHSYINKIAKKYFYQH